MKKYLGQGTATGDTRSDFENKIKNAIGISRRFLEQYHSPVIYKSARFDNNKWIISMEVGLIKEDIIEVVIDAETGKILSYNHSSDLTK